MKRNIRRFSILAAGLLAAAPWMVQAATRSASAEKPLQERVRHELAMLPYYGVFDSLSFHVDGNTVTLYGQVTRPTLKSDAANVVKMLAGVENVDNQIEVLPLSSFDDRIRLSVLRAVYGQPGLSRYARGPNSPIKIIVKNGNVTLEGVVGSEMDKNLAGIKANGVSNVFSVTNNLRLESAKS